MKVTVAPETKEEIKTVQEVSLVGLRSFAVVGVAYDGDVLRRPVSHSYGNLLDIMRELPVLQYHLSRHQLMVDAADPDAGVSDDAGS